MKPFNIKDFLAGKPVVTRTGKPVHQIHYLDSAIHESQRIVAVIDGQVSFHLENGRRLLYTDHDTDLFMKTTKFKGWMNIISAHGGYSGCFNGAIHENKAVADLYRTADTIACIEVEFED